MTRNLKYFITMFFILLLLCIIPNVVSAYEDTFTTEDGIVAKKTTVGTDGSLEFSISNITLDESKEYKWGISKSKDAEKVVAWYALAGDATNKKASFTLTDNESKIKSVLYSTDIAYLYIKENEGETYLVEGLKLDLTINPAESLKITYSSTWHEYYLGDIYGINAAFYQFVKVENGTDVPLNGWISVDEHYSSYDYGEVKEKNWIKEDGKYYVWCKFMESDSKIVYAYKTVTIDDNAPQVKSIKVVSPSEGTYNTPQTVKIRAYFTEAITGTTMPTLKIKFGDSAERELTNGTIHNESYENYIEYSYNIQDTDKGQIMTVSYEGGDIKDSAGNAAKLSTPLITGNAIKANVDGTTNNNTDNKDQNNDQTTKPTPTPTPVPTPTQTPNNSNNTNNKPTPVPTNIPTNNGSSNNNSSQKDDTISNVKLPNTGAGVILIISIITIVAGGTIAYLKYNKYRDI